MKRSYREGIKGTRYKIVSKSWRGAVGPARKIRNRRAPINPMVVDLLAGKTIFAYIEDRTTKSYGSLYAVASNNNRILRMHQFDDIDDEVFKGYLIWMEKRR